jgi:hypothetical protein
MVLVLVQSQKFPEHHFDIFMVVNLKVHVFGFYSVIMFLPNFVYIRQWVQRWGTDPWTYQ